jgi:hypothetical protein
MASPSMTHADLVKRLMLAVADRGFPWSNPTGALKADDRFIRYGLVGSSDILFVLRPTGRLIGIEAKVGDDAWRARQQKFAAALNAAGGLYILARSRDGTGDDAVAYTLDVVNGL